MISKKFQNLKIATILPYKEDYSFIKASAVSLWVAEFFKNSKFNNNNIIFGSTKTKDFLKLSQVIASEEIILLFKYIFKTLKDPEALQKTE